MAISGAENGSYEHLTDVSCLACY